MCLCIYMHVPARTRARATTKRRRRLDLLPEAAAGEQIQPFFVLAMHSELERRIHERFQSCFVMCIVLSDLCWRKA